MCVGMWYVHGPLLCAVVNRYFSFTNGVVEGTGYVAASVHEIATFFFFPLPLFIDFSFDVPGQFTILTCSAVAIVLIIQKKTLNVL